MIIKVLEVVGVILAGWFVLGFLVLVVLSAFARSAAKGMHRH